MKIKFKVQSGLLEYRDIMRRIDEDGKPVYVIEDVEGIEIEK